MTQTQSVLITHGAGITPLEVHGTVDSLQITENTSAAGGGFQSIAGAGTPH
jgi:hypothetical protein